MNKHLLSLACAALLSACGGGGSNGEVASTDPIDRYIGTWSRTCDRLSAEAISDLNGKDTNIIETIKFEKASVALAAPSLRFKKLGPLDNDEPSMLALLQDRQGFVWIGTHSNGLYRYDGYRAVKFAHARNNPRSLPHDRVAAIFEDKRGRLWAGTTNGLARYNPDSNDFTVFAPPSGPVNRLTGPDGAANTVQSLLS
eukprot:gene20548-23339_t